jgi:hypothetical protein
MLSQGAIMKRARLILGSIVLGQIVSCSRSAPPANDLAVTTAALTGGCTSGQPCTLTIPVPQGLTPQDVILTATSSLSASSSVTVKTSGGAFGTVANLGSGQTSIGVASHVGSTTTVGNLVSQGSVFLASNAMVRGSVTTGGTLTKQQGSVVTGTVTNHAVATDASRQVTVTFPTNASPVSVPPSGSRTLAPGSYGSVAVNSRATLSLSTGTYLFASLDTEPQSTLILNEAGGPIFIYVQTSLLYKGTESQTGGDANVFVGFFGTQPVSLQAPFRGTIVAPSAPLELTTQTAGFAGAFWGSAVQVDPNTPVTGLGAVLPPGAAGGVSPTLNCVVQLSSTTLGAVFGYTNTTGANVTLGAGPHNFFAPGDVDRGQPILFVPGQVLIASLQPFPAGTSLSYTIGQSAVVASSSSPTCPADIGTALIQLFVETPSSASVRQQAAAMLAGPQYSSWISTAHSSFGPHLTPFESSLLDAAALVAANGDLLGNPANLTAAQNGRVPAFRGSLLSNPAIVALRLAGDALRADPGGPGCSAIASVNTGQPIRTIGAYSPQAGSLYDQAQRLITSSAMATVEQALTNVANGRAPTALLAAPGLLLGALKPLSSIVGIQLSGAIPIGILSDIGAVVGGAVVGAVVGFAAGGPVGAVVGGVVGGVAGGSACLANQDQCDMFFGDTCQTCTGGASDTVNCPADPNDPSSSPICADGCCSNSTVPTGTISFLIGASCPGGVARCQRDFDCGTGLVCVQDCCVDPAAFASNCPPDASCTSNDGVCSPGNTCRFGCCVGPCGFNGVSCNVAAVPAVCSEAGSGSTSCPVGTSCSSGCCLTIVP